MSVGKADLSELNTIVNSPALRRIIAEHQELLQEKINKFVREQNIISAYGELCKLDDSNKLIKTITQKIAQIKEGEKDG